jgi:hypothetical protein
MHAVPALRTGGAAPRFTVILTTHGRSALIGSMRAARRAGATQASAAATVGTKGTTTNVTGSNGLTP